MKRLTLISTIHSEIGKSNADELLNLIELFKPEVIFLEALKDTYTEYQKMIFETSGIFHSKLEIKAVQKYSQNNIVNYIPVLSHGLSDTFDGKYNIVCQDFELQNMIDNFNYLAGKYGFDFLNSKEGMHLQEEMRNLENIIMGNSILNKNALYDIDRYENCMLKKIYEYCQNTYFKTGIFMCGVAHRTSLIGKISNYVLVEKTELNWEFFEGNRL